MKLIPQTSAPKIQLPGTKGSSYAADAKALFNKNLSTMNNESADKMMAEAGIAPRIENAVHTPKSPEVSTLSTTIKDQISTSEATTASALEEVVATPTPPPVEDPMSSKLAALARREKAIRARAQQQQVELEAKEAAFKAREDAFRAKESEYQSKYVSKDRLQQDTFNALAEAGLNYDQITEMMINNPSGKMDPAVNSQFQTLKAEIASLKAEAEASKKLFSEQQKQQYDTALTQITTDVRKAVRNNPEFETIDKTNSFNDVVELIEKTYNEGLGEDYPRGTILDIYEAAKLVEDQLSEDLYSYATKVSKVKNRLMPKADATAAAPQKQQSTQEQQLKTLTNTSSTSRKLSSRERAMLAFQGKLNS